MSPAVTIALTFVAVAPLTLLVAKWRGLQSAVNITAIACIAIFVAILLTGCGESVSEHRQNEKRDEALHDVEKDTSTIDQRLNELDARVMVLEKAHEENAK